jgi:hypothetical protein
MRNRKHTTDSSLRNLRSLRNLCNRSLYLYSLYSLCSLCSLGRRVAHWTAVLRRFPCRRHRMSPN